jgi:hypothetical protein
MVRAILLSLLLTAASSAADLSAEARAAMAKASRFFRSIATEGGYLWQYSLDLKTRRGEEPAGASQIWVQSPGTPAMGQAFLRAYRATGDAQYLEAADAAAGALVRGQLESGGWDYQIEFDPALRRKWNYRGSNSGGQDRSTLDDDNTQSALRLLMDVHKARPHPALKEAIDYGLRKLLEAQHEDGGFPQRYPPPAPQRFAYYDYATLNDNAILTVAETLWQAFEHYGEERYWDAVRNVGEFLIATQLPAAAGRLGAAVPPHLRLAGRGTAGGPRAGVGAQVRTAVALHARERRRDPHAHLAVPKARRREVHSPHPAGGRVVGALPPGPQPLVAVLRVEDQPPAVLHAGLQARVHR